MTSGQISIFQQFVNRREVKSEAMKKEEKLKKSKLEQLGTSPKAESLSISHSMNINYTFISFIYTSSISL